MGSRTTLEVFHAKIRELGSERFKTEIMDACGVNHHVLGSIALGRKPLNGSLEALLKERYPTEFVESISDGVDIVPGKPEVGTLNFAVCIAVRNSYDPMTAQAIFSLIRRTGCGIFQLPFDSMIARSRNRIAVAFLRSTFEWSLWLDDDMIVPTGDANTFRMALGEHHPISDEFAGLSAPLKLSQAGKTIVSAIYFSRHGTPQITAGFNPGTSIQNPLPSNGLLPAAYCGFGCVLIHRRVYEDIAAKWPELATGEGNFFTTFRDGDRMCGEDESFCRRAAEVGHPTFLDMSVVCGHVGRKVNYIPQNSIG